MPAKKAKKAAPKKTAKKSTAKKAPAKKAAAKKTTAKKTTAPVAKKRRIAKPKSATGALTQSEFVVALQEFCGLEKKSEAKELAGDISELITMALKKGYRLPFFSLGKLYVRKTKRRKGRNPATGETITIPARKKVRFTAGKALKEAVL